MRLSLLNQIKKQQRKRERKEEKWKVHEKKDKIEMKKEQWAEWTMIFFFLSKGLFSFLPTLWFLLKETGGNTELLDTTTSIPNPTNIFGITLWNWNLTRRTTPILCQQNSKMNSDNLGASPLSPRSEIFPKGDQSPDPTPSGSSSLVSLSTEIIRSEI